MASKGSPSGYLDRPNDFGLSAGAYPRRVAADPEGSAAAWAQHLLIRRLRTWLPVIGVRTPTEWRVQRDLPKKPWQMNFNGTRWLPLNEVAFIASQAPTPEDAATAVEEFGRALRGEAYPPIPAAAQARSRVTRAEAGVRVPRQRPARMGKAGTGEPVDAIDTIWQSLDALANENNVEVPAELFAFERDGVYAVSAATGGTAVVTLPSLSALPLPMVGPHAILEGVPQSGSEVVALTFADTDDDGPEFVARTAIVTDAGEIEFH